jgi:hypothetical protein
VIKGVKTAIRIVGSGRGAQCIRTTFKQLSYSFSNIYLFLRVRAASAYIHRGPPKSCGREQGRRAVRDIVEQGDAIVRGPALRGSHGKRES